MPTYNDYKDDAIKGSELKTLLTSVAKKLKECSPEVIAAALVDLDSRLSSLEYDGQNLGDAVADSVDAQVLKIGGEDVSGMIDECLKKSGIRGFVRNDGSIDTSVYALASALSDYILKSSTTGLVKNDGSIDTTAYATKAELAGYLEKSLLNGIMKNDGSVIAANGDVYPLDISGNAHTVDDYHIVVGSVGSNANTIYFW